jgi:hypothetical protein
VPGFRIVVTLDDGTEVDLGKHESDFLPRVGESVSLWDKLVARDSPDAPFRGFVADVTHDEFKSYGGGTVSATVWLTAEKPEPEEG